jgi:hypothetical protein
MDRMQDGGFTVPVCATHHAPHQTGTRCLSDRLLQLFAEVLAYRFDRGSGGIYRSAQLFFIDAEVPGPVLQFPSFVYVNAGTVLRSAVFKIVSHDSFFVGGCLLMKCPRTIGLPGFSHSSFRPGGKDEQK